MKNGKTKLYRRKKIYKAYCFDLVVDTVRWPNQKKLDRVLLIHPGISVIVPLLDRNHMILLHQYRYGAKRRLWELPAGTIDGKESPLSCARREIEEEIGYQAKTWKKLASCYASPGFNTEIIHSFLASNLVETQTNLEDDEVLEPKVFRIDKVEAMVRSGKIQDAKSLIALFYFFEQRKKR